MCKDCDQNSHYADAYQNVQGVRLSMWMYCPDPKCIPSRALAEVTLHIGERWEPFVKCSRCGKGIVMYVDAKQVFETRVK